MRKTATTPQLGRRDVAEVAGEKRVPGTDWRPAFLADWAGATFVHFEVPAEVLEKEVPFPLHLYNGAGYVSLVAFTMGQMRPAWLDSRVGELLLRPIAPCRFLNVRTYVRVGGQTGIFFLGEWLSNWINIPLGPLFYGLPYRAGRVHFREEEPMGEREVEVNSPGGDRLSFRARRSHEGELGNCEPGSLDAFLLERYAAFTKRGACGMRFQVEHEAWQQTPAEIDLEEMMLLKRRWRWVEEARLVGGHLTPGAFNVAMGAAERIRG